VKASPTKDAVGSTGEAGEFREIVLEGRKYRLVPVDEPPRAARRARELLTARELEIATLIAKGRGNKQIAVELQISEWTVGTHLRRIFEKLGVDTRAAMVTKCFDALGAEAE
jgi:DNA-binding CsgD family transcriptional regulator